MILEQYRGVFVGIDDGWIPVKKYIEEGLGVNTERERAYYDEWDEAALRDIIQRQRKITELLGDEEAVSGADNLRRLCR